MKIHHFVLIFILFFISVVIKTDIKIGQMEEIANEKATMIESLYTASSDAINCMAASGNFGSNLINKDEVINTFFDSLYSNMDIISDTDAQAEIEMYIPVILLCDNDGYYVYYYEDYKDNVGNTFVKRIWSEKMPYYYKDDYFIYRFFLTDTVSVCDVNNFLPDSLTKVIEADYHEFQTDEKYQDLRDSHNNCILLNAEQYQLTKKQTIVNKLEEVLSYYTNKHNYIARQNGITYNFTFPPGCEGEWAQYLDDVSMVVVFQGYPYGADKNYTFNKIASVRANIIKKPEYFVEEKSWYKLVHKEGCPKLIHNTMVIEDTYESIEECARSGAYCDDCIDHGPRAPEIR